MSMQNQKTNHAHIELAPNADQGNQALTFLEEDIIFLHAETDQPGAEYDVVIYNQGGNELFREQVKSEHTKWGRRIDLEMGDDNYPIIAIENVKGKARVFDVFAE